MTTITIPLRPAVRAGDWIAVSGQLGVQDGALVAGAQAQTARALENLHDVLRTCGAELSDVVKVNVFLTSMQDYAVMNTEYAAVFGGAEPPARTAVAELPFGALVEIEAWVFHPSA